MSETAPNIAAWAAVICLLLLAVVVCIKAYREAKERGLSRGKIILAVAICAIPIYGWLQCWILLECETYHLPYWKWALTFTVCMFSFVFLIVWAWVFDSAKKKAREATNEIAKVDPASN